MISPIFRAGLAALLLGGLAACGGGGGSSAIPSGGPNTSSIISQNGNNFTITGTITAVWGGGFTLQVGAPAGFLHVYTNSSTSITGGTPYVGENVIVSGTGSMSSSLTATSVAPQSAATPGATPTPAPGGPTPTPGPVGATIALPSGVSAFVGPVSKVGSGYITINGGSSYGLFKVYTNGSTTFLSGSPAVGSIAQITGTGTAGYSMTAVTASFVSSTPGNVNVSGQVAAQTPYGFTLNSNGTSIPVALTKNTVVGGATLQVGSNVTVNGQGTTSTSITAVSIVVAAPTPPPGTQPTPTPGPIGQTHVLTSDYLGGRYGTHNVSWSAAASWLNYAQTGTSDANAIAATGIKTQLYVDPNRTQGGSGDPLYTSNEATFAHDCSGNRVSDVFSSTQQYVMDIGGSAMQNQFVSYVNGQIGQAHWDTMFMDDSGPLSEYGLGSFSPGLPCNYSDAGWISAGQALDQLSPIPVIFNGLGALNGHDPSLSMQLLSSSNTIGGNYEHCYTDSNSSKMGAWQWAAIENTELQVAAQNKLFFCQERNLSSADSSSDARLYSLASFLLTYNPQSSVLWEEFATNSGFHVLPEAQLVPMNPVVSTPASVTGLQLPGGAYGREFKNCYIAGRFASSCAVVVNPDTQFSHTFPLPQYQHTLVLSGGGILDGGTIATNGPQPPTTLAPLQAEIVFP